MIPSIPVASIIAGSKEVEVQKQWEQKKFLTAVFKMKQAFFFSRKLIFSNRNNFHTVPTPFSLLVPPFKSIQVISFKP